MTSRKPRHDPPCPGPQAHKTRHGKPSCTGHLSPRQGEDRAGQPCKQPPMPGATICYYHGGEARQVKAAAKQRMEIAKVEKWLIDNIADATPLTSMREVYDEILEVAGQARAWRLITAQRVSELTSLGYAGLTGEQVKAEVLLFERGMDRSVKFTDMIARLDLDTKRAALEERLSKSQGAQVAEVMKVILGRLNLTPEQWQLVGVVVPEEFRRLSAGGAP